MSDPRKEIVRTAYNAIAGDYVAWSVGSKVRLRFLQKLLERLPKGAAVLELGCGAGLPVTKALAEHGPVTAVDISAAQIALAGKNAPDATLICADMMALQFEDETFDAVAAFYAITHLPKEEHGELFRRIFGWLKPGGWLIASLGSREADDVVDNNWLGKPNFFSHHDPETSLTLLAEAGFTSLEYELARQDLKGEENVRFLWVTARKPQL